MPRKPCEALLSVQRLYIQLFLLAGGFIGLYYPFIVKMVEDWDTNANYSHGFFIPFISGYMIYSLRDRLRAIKIEPATWGILFLTLGLMQLIVAKVGSEFFMQRTSMLVVLFGISLFLVGTGFTKAIWFPLAYLIFMIPLPAIVWNKAAFPMQIFASTVAERSVQLLGIPILREGNVLHLAETTLEVVDACSGLRSLSTMIALSAALAFFTDAASVWKKWAIFFASAPIAIIANVIRLTGTAILAQRYGEKVAQGFLHDFSGWLIFVIGLMALLGLRQILIAKEQGTAPT